MTINEMANAYSELAYTHNYIFGFAYKHTVYAYTVNANAETLAGLTTLEAASRNAGLALRFKPSAALKAELAKTATVICEEAEIENAVNGSKYNRGEIFEKIITERAGQVWVKDNVPFTCGGDIEINGIAYQIKYQKATFTNEATLRNLTAHLK